MSNWDKRENISNWKYNFFCFASALIKWRILCFYLPFDGELEATTVKGRLEEEYKVHKLPENWKLRYNLINWLCLRRNGEEKERGTWEANRVQFRERTVAIEVQRCKAVEADIYEEINFFRNTPLFCLNCTPMFLKLQ